MGQAIVTPTMPRPDPADTPTPPKRTRDYGEILGLVLLVAGVFVLGIVFGLLAGRP
jgi:hypothetical protein